MKSDIHVLSVILIVAAVTVSLRALPFVAVGFLSKNKYLSYIGNRMPVGVMILLVAYTFQHVSFSVYPWGIPVVVCSLLSICLYWLTSNALIGIGGSLAVYLYVTNVL